MTNNQVPMHVVSDPRQRKDYLRIEVDLGELEGPSLAGLALRRAQSDATTTTTTAAAPPAYTAIPRCPEEPECVDVVEVFVVVERLEVWAEATSDVELCAAEELTVTLLVLDAGLDVVLEVELETAMMGVIENGAE